MSAILVCINILTFLSFKRANGRVQNAVLNLNSVNSSGMTGWCWIFFAFVNVKFEKDRE